MKINFYPECDNPEFEKAAKEYQKIWEKDGTKITTTIERVSGLKFKEKVINAIVQKYVSYSSPLRLQANVPIKLKATTLTHELCHRALTGNDIKNKVLWNHPSYTLELHKVLDLILYDILIDLFGQETADEEIKYEVSLWDGKDISPYKIAWDWALQMSREKRQKEFKKYYPKK